LWEHGTGYVEFILPLSRAVPNVVVVLKVGALIFIAWMWVSTVIDQVPCFMGVPNCD
jgi:hypothetical protein